MSDSKYSKTTETEGGAVDWAERLRASMNQSPAENAATPPPADEDDELAALLRAQLARAQNAPAAAELPDTSDFEEDLPAEDEEAPIDEYEFPAEDEEAPIDEYEFPAEDEGEPIDEVEEDLPAEDEEAPIDEYEFPAEDEGEPIDESEEDLPDEDEEEPIDVYEEELLDIYEEAPFYEEREDLVEEEYDENDYHEDDPPANFRVVYSTAPDDRDAPGVLRAVPVRAEPEKDMSPLFRPMTDGALNGRTGASAMERQLFEENKRLLEEEARHRAAAAAIYADEVFESPEASDVPTDGEMSDTEGAKRESAGRRRARPALIGYDPLQIGHDGQGERPASARRIADILDDELPVTPIASVRPMAPASATVAAAENYTAAMPGDTEADVRRRDAALWMALGYTDEVLHAEDRRAAEQVSSEAGHAAMDRGDADRHVTPAPDENEYTGRADTRRVVARYRKDRRARLIRMGVAATGVLLALLWDVLPAVLGILEKGSGLFTDPVYPVVGLCLTVAALLPFLTRLGRGVRGLLRFAPTRYSVTCIALTADLLYTVLCIVAAAVWALPMPLFGVIPLFALSVAAMSEIADAEGEWNAFQAVCTGRAVYVLTDEQTPATAALGGRRNGFSRHTAPAPLTVVRTALVDHVFARMGQYNPYMGRLNYLLPCALGTAIACAGITLVRGGDLVADGARVFTAVLLSALPAAYIIAMSFPIHRANSRLASRGCAVIGTAAPEQYINGKESREARAVCFADRDVISAALRKEITLRPGTEGADAVPTAHWRHLANCLFHLLGSPLAADSPAEDSGSPERLEAMHVEIAETDIHYMKAYLIDKTPGAETTVEIMMGSYDALSRRGIRLPRRSMETAYRKSPDSHVVYLAFDGHFRIAYAAEYRVKRSFAATADALASCKARPVMVSYDPMLTGEMLTSPRFGDMRGLEIIRPDCVDIPRRRCSSGMVAVGHARELVYPLAACRRMHTGYRLAYGFSWLCYGVITALCLTLALTGQDARLDMALLLGIQNLSAAAMLLTVLTTVTRESLLLPPHGGKPAPTQKKSRMTKEPRHESK